MAKKNIRALLNESEKQTPAAPDPAMDYIREQCRKAREGLKSAADLEQILKDNATLLAWIDRVSIPSETSAAADVVRKRVPELIDYINTIHEKYNNLIFALAVHEYNQDDTRVESESVSD